MCVLIELSVAAPYPTSPNKINNDKYLFKSKDEHQHHSLCCNCSPYKNTKITLNKHSNPTNHQPIQKDFRLNLTFGINSFLCDHIRDVI